MLTSLHLRETARRLQLFRRRLLRSHPLLGILALNLVAGLLIGAIAVGGLLLLDTHGLRSLILRDASPAAALLLLSFGFAITFGSALMGCAIMKLPRETPEAPPSAGSGDGSRALPVPARGCSDMVGRIVAQPAALPTHTTLETRAKA